ncbi:TadE family type IV pilus minor pilin [Arsenicicoccus cauae]|uniref:TadE family type IV pilus minor pilin n=1 Tax=Arsenicicoccus cauae TaxID=2663847 RepID=UPI00370D0B5D
MVTTELAVGTLSVALCLAVGLQAVALGIDEVRCVDAAHVAARAAARGEDGAAVLGLARRLAPPGSAVGSGVGAGTVRVRVQAPARGLSRLLPGVPPAAAEASVPVEVGAGEQVGPGRDGG